jgi:hypothetical protein
VHRDSRVDVDTGFRRNASVISARTRLIGVARTVARSSSMDWARLRGGGTMNVGP